MVFWKLWLSNIGVVWWGKWWCMLGCDCCRFRKLAAFICFHCFSWDFVLLLQSILCEHTLYLWRNTCLNVMFAYPVKFICLIIFHQTLILWLTVKQYLKWCYYLWTYDLVLSGYLTLTLRIVYYLYFKIKRHDALDTIFA